MAKLATIREKLLKQVGSLVVFTDYGQMLLTEAGPYPRHREE